jgi:hypothetical protein
MERDDFWIAHINDNRIRGLLGELSEAIADCEDPDTINRLRSSLGKGFTNFAASRERELREIAAQETRTRFGALHDKAMTRIADAIAGSVAERA